MISWTAHNSYQEHNKSLEKGQMKILPHLKFIQTNKVEADCTVQNQFSSGDADPPPHCFLTIFSQIMQSLLIGGGMFFQSQYEQAEPLCLDISVCRIMNFSWNTKVSDTHIHTHAHTITQSYWVILRALFGYIYSWKRQTVQACAPFYRGIVYILTPCFSFTTLRGCFISFTPAQLITSHICLLFCFVLCHIFTSMM